MARKLVPLLCLLLAAGAPPLFAQRVTGQIVGTVTDDTGAALPGVTVTLKGPAVVGQQTSMTNEKGFYRFPTLPPGVYTLTYSLSGFGTVNHEGVRAAVGSTLEENVNLKVAAKTEEVTVMGEAAVVNAQSDQVSTNYDKDWVRNAPIPRYTFFDLINAAPGVSQTSSDVQYRQTSFGSATTDNSYQLDGTDFTAPVSGAAWPYPNTDAIEEIEVLSLGAPAEYGNLQGAVFNVVTRQGGNDFHGDLNYYYQSQGLTSRNTTDAEDEGNPYHRDRYNDVTFQLSGPIVKDKLWFFGSYQFQQDYNSPAGVDKAFPSRQKNNRVFGKLNWQINSKHKLMFAYHDDFYNLPDTGSAVTAPSTLVLNHGHNPSPNLTYTAVLSDKTYVEARYSGFYGHDLGDPLESDVAKAQPRYLDLESGEITGGIYSWYDGKSTKTGVNVKVSHFSDNFIGGSHDFKFGVQYNQGGGNYTVAPNDYIYTYGGVPSYGYTQLPYKQNGQMKAIGVYADDTFRIGSRLALNLGLRYDYSRASLPASPILDRLGNPGGQSTAAIDNLFEWKNSISPRVGFTLKLTGDGRSVLKGHYGRYYRGIITGEFDNTASSISPRYLFSGTYDAQGNPEGLELVSDNSNLRVDPGFKNPYTDQFIGGFEQELVRNVGLSLYYIHKRGEDYGGWHDIGGQYEPATFVDETGKSIAVQALVSDPTSRLFLLTNPPEMFTRYNGFSAQITKRMSSHWQMVMSLVLSKSTGRLGSSRSGLKNSQSATASDFGQNPNDFINTDGRLIGDRPVVFKTQIVYQMPYGFLLGANFVHQSGRPWARQARVPDLGIPTTILAEPIDGSRRLPDWNMLDVNLMKEFGLGGQAHLGLFAYALNLTNADFNEDVQSRLGTSSSFGLASGFVFPRRVMLGARLRF
jgi:hypothetical protein